VRFSDVATVRRVRTEAEWEELQKKLDERVRACCVTLKWSSIDGSEEHPAGDTSSFDASSRVSTTCRETGSQVTWSDAWRQSASAEIGRRFSRRVTLTEDDRDARRVLDAFSRVALRQARRARRPSTDFVREAAYGGRPSVLLYAAWRARLIDEVILQKEAYSGRSLQHQRLARKEPERCSGGTRGSWPCC